MIKRKSDIFYVIVIKYGWLVFILSLITFICSVQMHLNSKDAQSSTTVEELIAERETVDNFMFTELFRIEGRRLDVYEPIIRQEDLIRKKLAAIERQINNLPSHLKELRGYTPDTKEPWGQHKDLLDHKNQVIQQRNNMLSRKQEIAVQRAPFSDDQKVKKLWERRQEIEKEIKKLKKDSTRILAAGGPVVQTISTGLMLLSILMMVLTISSFFKLFFKKYFTK